MLFETHKLGADDAFTAGVIKNLIFTLCARPPMVTRQSPADVLAIVAGHVPDITALIESYRGGALRNESELHYAVEALMLRIGVEREAA